MVKITKRLSFGLTSVCLSTVLLMNSCSEDALTPVPEAAVNKSSNLRESINPIQPVYLAPTLGQPGMKSLPNGWTSLKNYATSDVHALGGNPNTPWLTANLASPESGFTKFITLKTQYSPYNSENKSCWAESQIKNLKPGKKYELTFYVSTNKAYQGGEKALLAEEVYFQLRSETNLFGFLIVEHIDLKSKPEQWIKKTIAFTAEEPTLEILFKVNHPGWVTIGSAYTNIFISPTAVKQIN
ncbi:hypothetical protein FEM33_03170 [Dyadobacter flavalbus]|uniref:CBM-cenC domain-containing protein n=1 Tax=Dyadobacter flavalbus TaxID=2579942 RepID=A0A5M8R585_9BACT|nr:hypothetical protein [Dyadobacter flavalbus]KAA6441322.1 hypothetical protein FEM33_03170 [Dyadobacter flavalbus]